MSTSDRLVVAFVVAALFTAVGWGVAGSAMADVDPPSDVLVLESVYFPYRPPVCTQLKKGLDTLTRDAKRAGYPVKVALVASAQDLGGIPQVFGKPQEYADFLHQEIGRQVDGVVLAAMPGGFGLAPKEPERYVLKKISIPDDADSNRLARAAIEAIPKLAEAAGQTVKKPNIGSGCSKKSGSSAAFIFIVPIALLLIAGAAITLARRGTSGPSPA